MSHKGTSPNPGPTAVYRAFDGADRLLYIGVSNNPPVRWAAHAREKTWWADVARKTVCWYSTRVKAEAVEESAVPEERPLYNIAHTPLHRQVGWPNRATPAEIARWLIVDSKAAYATYRQRPNDVRQAIDVLVAAELHAWGIGHRFQQIISGEPTGVGVPGRKPKKGAAPTEGTTQS